LCPLSKRTFNKVDGYDFQLKINGYACPRKNLKGVTKHKNKKSIQNNTKVINRGRKILISNISILPAIFIFKYHKKQIIKICTSLRT